MTTSHFEFVEIVAAARDLVITRSDAHNCRLEPREQDALAWHCILDDGFSNDSERDPASSVIWVCPELRVRHRTDSDLPMLEVRRAAQQSDLGRLLKGFGRLTGRPRQPTPDAAEARFIYTDPSGALDAELRERIENWPSAMHGNGVMQQAELSSIARTGEGLRVGSNSWWGSASTLEHQIALGVEVAHRLAARR